jgi:predicted transcriptional regulator
MEKRKYNALNDAQIMERDNVLIDFLYTHKGAENRVSSNEIAEYLTAQGYPQKANSVHMLMTRLLMKKHVPICSLNCKGYYWAASKNDIKIAIADLESRINAIQEHADALKAFLFE